MKKRIVNLIFETYSIKAFIVLVLILFSIESKIKFNISGIYIYKVIIYIFIFLFIARIIYRGIKLHKLIYFDGGYSNDSLKRAHQLGDLSIIIAFGMFLLELRYMDSKNSILEAEFFIALFYSLVAYFSISQGYKCVEFRSVRMIIINIILKIITLFTATIQGLFAVLYMLTFSLESVNKLLAGSTIHLSLNFSKCILSLCYIAENFMPETIYMILTSIVLFIILIINTPAYQLEDLHSAFKIFNFLIVLLGVLIYFCANLSYSDIQTYITSIVNKKIVPDSWENTYYFISYIKKFSKANITNTGYLLALPYTLGILLSNLIIEFLKKRNSKKAASILDNIITLRNSNSENSTVLTELKNKYDYYCGDKSMYKILQLVYTTKEK